MTTWQSLLYCAAADVTLERVRNLVAVTGTEPLTVEFKEASTPAVARRSCRPSVMGRVSRRAHAGRPRTRPV